MRRLLMFLFLAVPMLACAQTQQGYVKILGRPDKKGVALSGVFVRVKGGHNAVLSKQDGTFALQMSGKKNGDAYALQQVQKEGYELNEVGVIGRQYAFSDKVPLTIVMVSTAQLQADKLRIENNAYQVAERNYKARLAQLEKQKEDNAITIEEYRQQLQDLQDKFDKYQSLIDGLADHYAHVDYDNLDEKEREINLCIEHGDLERADSLLHTLFDPTDVLKRNKDAIAKIEQQESQARDILAQANADMAKVLKQQEKDAEYLYQLYTIALAKFDNEKALQYIETRATLDSTNVLWQFQAGDFINEFKADYAKAESYFQLLLRQALIQFGEKSEWVGRAYNNLGVIYAKQNDFIKSLDYFKEVLLLEQYLGKDNPCIAEAYNNIGVVYFYQAKYQDALKYISLGLSIREKLLGASHSDVAQSYNNLGGVYDNQGKYLDALTCYSKALEIRKEIYGMEHPDVAQSYNNQGNVYDLLNDTTNALKCYSVALTIREKTLGDSHPDVGASHVNLGSLYDTMGNYEKALEENFIGLDIFLKTLGEDNTLCATAYGNIATVYRHQGNSSRALEYNYKALEIFKRELGNEHPNIAILYSNIGGLYETDYKYKEALELYLEAFRIFEKYLGADHYQTKNVKEKIRLLELKDDPQSH